MLALDTRTALTRQRGLAEGIAALAPLVPCGLFLDAGPAAQRQRSVPQGAVVAALESAGVPLLGLMWRPEHGTQHHMAVDGHEGVLAAKACAAAIATLPQLRTRTLVLHCGDGGLADAQDLRTASAGHQNERVAQLHCARQAAFEAAVERLLRRLHALLSACSGVRILLRNEADAASLLTADSAEWLLAELSKAGLGIALDSGAAGLAATRGGLTAEGWLARHGGAARLLLLSDHDGQNRADVLPGLGRTPAAEFATLRAGESPRVLCLDPELDARALLVGARFAAGLCGAQ